MSSGHRVFMRRRSRLVRELREKGISCERILAAIGRVAREQFVEPALRNRAYEDEALPIGLNQTISQPYTVAYQTMLLDPRPGESILEVGTGSGYQAATLCEMGVRVYSIERHVVLHQRARDTLGALGYRVLLRLGDGTLGWTACAPFDGIIVTAAALAVPQQLLGQLKQPDGDRPGGRLVVPVGDDRGQTMLRIDCTGEGTYETHETGLFRFVPLVAG